MHIRKILAGLVLLAILIFVAMYSRQSESESICPELGPLVECFADGGRIIYHGDNELIKREGIFGFTGSSIIVRAHYPDSDSPQRLLEYNLNTGVIRTLPD